MEDKSQNEFLDFYERKMNDSSNRFEVDSTVRVELYFDVFNTYNLSSKIMVDIETTDHPVLKILNKFLEDNSPGELFLYIQLHSVYFNEGEQKMIIRINHLEDFQKIEEANNKYIQRKLDEKI